MQNLFKKDCRNCVQHQKTYKLKLHANLGIAKIAARNRSLKKKLIHKKILNIFL